ncbi:MAG: cupin domain-containing protein [Candidatus Thorarchaeota archaeon]
MTKDLVLDWSDLLWDSTRPTIAKGVLGSMLLSEGADVQKVTLTRVEPEGTFLEHTDDYAHIFLFLEGQGEGWLGGEMYAIHPRMVVRVPAGLSHGYRNTGTSDLILLTINYRASNST